MSQRSDTDRDRDALPPEDAALVRSVAEAWRAPEPTPAQRVDFQRRLDERLAAEARGFGGVRGLRALAGAAAAAAAVALAIVALGERGGREEATLAGAPPTTATVTAAAPERPAPSAADRGDAIWALATEDESGAADAAAAGYGDALPDDYLAIASLFVDG